MSKASIPHDQLVIGRNYLRTWCGSSVRVRIIRLGGELTEITEAAKVNRVRTMPDAVYVEDDA